jgi:peroxiredoxin 2/4
MKSKLFLLAASLYFFLPIGRIAANDPAATARVAEQSEDRRINSSIPLIGTKAPSFTAPSTEGVISFPEDFGDNWKIIFSHPKNFTPVCSSELLELAHEQESFNEMGAKLIVVSTDILDQHFSWKRALEEIPFRGRDPVEINFPMVDDHSYRVSNLYGMIHQSVNIGKNIRGVFIIDPENRIRAISFYPNEVGRNINELQRTLAALKKTYNDEKIATPSNWLPGDDVMVPVVSSDELENIGEPGSQFYRKSWFMTYRKAEEKKESVP